MVRTYGQMPKQLFASPHLPHLNYSIPSHALTISARALGGGGGRRTAMDLFPSVKGLRWGEFVGSPECDPSEFPAAHYSFEPDSRDEKIDHLVAILPRESLRIPADIRDSLLPGCYGIPAECELITNHRVERSNTPKRVLEHISTHLLNWRSTDNALRIRSVRAMPPHFVHSTSTPGKHTSSNQHQPWINLIDFQSLKATKVAFSTSKDLLFVGFSCGLIRAYTLAYRSDAREWRVELRSELVAHNCEITSMRVSEEFHLLVSTSIDALALSWDTNSLEFVNQLQLPPYLSAHSLPETITLSCISATSGDIACVLHQSGTPSSSRVALYTINGRLVGIHEGSEVITALAMTSLPEGTGINCMALGLQSGVVRLVEMWTMTVVREIYCPQTPTCEPVISIQFTNDCRRMYAATADSRVYCWQASPLPHGHRSAGSSHLQHSASLMIGIGTSSPVGKRSRKPLFRVLNTDDTLL